MPKKGKYFRE